MQSQSTYSKVSQMARQQGAIRVKDLIAAGINPAYLWRLHARGVLERVSRGVYRLADAEVDPAHALAVVAKRVPEGVICLLSALRFHEIGTQNPFEVWVAIHQDARRPTIDNPSVRIVYHSGDALTAGIVEHTIEGIRVRIYDPAKTVADCFKHRNKIGLDVALEALRDGWRQRKFTMDALEHYARVCRVSNVMRPYVEAMVG